MIVINIDKAKEIALKAAKQVQDEVARVQFQNAIAEAKEVKELAAVVENIKVIQQP